MLLAHSCYCGVLMLYILAYLLIGLIVSSNFIMFDSKNVSPYAEIGIYDVIVYTGCLVLWPLCIVTVLLIYWIKFLRSI
jgi:hypothetical protein